MTTDTAEPSDRVERTVALFEAGEWETLADLAVSETFGEDDVAALAAVHGGRTAPSAGRSGQTPRIGLKGSRRSA